MRTFSIDGIGHVPSFKTGKEANVKAIMRHIFQQLREGKRPSLKGLKNMIKTKDAHRIWMDRATDQLRAQYLSPSGSQTIGAVI